MDKMIKCPEEKEKQHIIIYGNIRRKIIYVKSTNRAKRIMLCCKDR